ncbi:MAG: hypothetical protein ACM3JI_03890 [Anaerolineae bacterium]
MRIPSSSPTAPRPGRYTPSKLAKLPASLQKNKLAAVTMLAKGKMPVIFHSFTPKRLSSFDKKLQKISHRSIKH